MSISMAVMMSSGCSSEKMPDPIKDIPETSGTELAVSVALSGPTRADGNSGFEKGEGYENYLDIDHDNYRIYFFSGGDNPTFISTFKPIMKPSVPSDPVLINNVETYIYNFRGEVPADLGTKFRLVVLANWPEYPEEKTVTPDGYCLVKGETTLTSIYNHAKAQFSYLSSPESSEEWLGLPDRLMPFYGVREYDLATIENGKYLEDGKIKDNTLIDLNSNELSLPLLRAMAKVEVILDNPIADFDTVIIDKVNYKGFCAPDALQHSDYFHDYDWDKDFIHKLHLPDRKDNYDYISIPMRRTKGTDGKYTKRWIAYVPEYRNISDEQNNISESDVTFISVKLKETGRTFPRWRTRMGNSKQGAQHLLLH